MVRIADHDAATLGCSELAASEKPRPSFFVLGTAAVDPKRSKAHEKGPMGSKGGCYLSRRARSIGAWTISSGN
jgi:hypothetical protein